MFRHALAALVLTLSTVAGQSELRLNHTQGKGTHNSYHQRPPIVLHPTHDYSHATLTDQLDKLGVRCFELDVHHRRGKGLQVFHLPRVDERSSNPTLEGCLREIKRWSDAHPKHLPVMVWIEPKDDVPRFDRTLLDVRWQDIEQIVQKVWPAERTLRPDDVRGDHATMPEAIRKRGWPSLDAVRGKAIFGLLDGGSHLRAYTKDAPNLEGRRMFVRSRRSTAAHAAIFKLDDARRQGDRIRRLVAEGFLVATNSDKTGTDAKINAHRLKQSLACGAHWLCSDFPAPRNKGGYACVIPGGSFARVNPVSGPKAHRGRPVAE